MSRQHEMSIVILNYYLVILKSHLLSSLYSFKYTYVVIGVHFSHDCLLGLRRLPTATNHHPKKKIKGQHNLIISDC